MYGVMLYFETSVHPLSGELLAVGLDFGRLHPEGLQPDAVLYQTDRPSAAATSTSSPSASAPSTSTRMLWDIFRI